MGKKWNKKGWVRTREKQSYPRTTDSVTTDSGKLISPSLVCNKDRYRWKTENVATLLPFVSLIHPSLDSEQEGKGEKRCNLQGLPQLLLSLSSQPHAHFAWGKTAERKKWVTAGTKMRYGVHRSLSLVVRPSTQGNVESCAYFCSSMALARFCAACSLREASCTWYCVDIGAQRVSACVWTCTILHCMTYNLTITMCMYMYITYS